MIQAIIIILAVTMPVVALFRAVLVKRVQALMLRTSPATASVPSLLDEAQEVTTPTTPRVVRLDSASIAPEADAARQAETLPARSLFRRSCLYDAVAVTSLFALWYFNRSDPEILLVAALFLILVSLRYALYAGKYKDQAIQSTAPHGWFRRWIGVAPEWIFRLLTHPRYAWYPLVLIAYLLYSAGQAVDGIEIWIAFWLIIPALLRVHIARLARKGTNRRLLILRVFGKDESTTLTFGAIRNFWQHIGSTFTVVDGAYIRYKYRSHSETQVEYAFFSCLAWISVFGTPEFNDWWGISLLLVLAYAVGCGIAYLRAPQSFATSATHIKERLQRFLHRPRRLDLTYKNLDMYCFDNTWKSAVAAFVAATDVVLMDLRGYSEQNKGCELEVNYLFDTTPINRIVFLVNGENNMQAVEDLVCTAWKRLHATSLNLATPDPVAKVYDIKDERRDDVRGLINTLVASATRM